MLDKAQKENWLKALRSGDYQQGRFTLRNGNRFCCIGVFAHCNNIPLSADGGVMLDEEGNEIGYQPLTAQIGYQDGILWRMNDSEGKSFLEIADYIEQNL